MLLGNNSKEVRGADGVGGGRCWAVVVPVVDQILPRYVLNLTYSSHTTRASGGSATTTQQRVSRFQVSSVARAPGRGARRRVVDVRPLPSRNKTLMQIRAELDDRWRKTSLLVRELPSEIAVQLKLERRLRGVRKLIMADYVCTAQALIMTHFRKIDQDIRNNIS